MSETTDTTEPQPGDQPGDGTPVNEVPDAPTVVDDPSEPVESTPTAEEFDALKQRVAELEDRATDPAPTAPAAASPFVEWDDHDEWGNPRTFYGVVLGEHPWEPGHVQVARLVPRVDGYDPAILRPLES